MGKQNPKYNGGIAMRRQDSILVNSLFKLTQQLLACNRLVPWLGIFEFKTRGLAPGYRRLCLSALRPLICQGWVFT